MAATAARRCAFEVVMRVFEDGAYADRALRAASERLELSERDRSFAMQVAYGTVQRKATLDYLVGRLAGRPPESLDPAILAALRIGLYQLVYLEGVREHAAVDQSVELAKAAGGAGFRLVNAVLRRATKEAAALVGRLADDDPEGAALRHSHPDWLVEMWWRELGAGETRALLATDNEPAESALRANTLKLDAGKLVARLGEGGVEARTDELAPEAVIVLQPFDAFRSPLFEEGVFIPQSRASMLVAHAVDPRPGERVLDLCAGPGAKTTHLAALMQNRGSIVAVEKRPERAEAIATIARRLDATCIAVEIADALTLKLEPEFDRVLLDPPCTALGTLQARPDVRWRQSLAGMDELADLQARLLARAAGLVRAGGSIVYSTCTITRRENEGQVSAFLESHPHFRLDDLGAAWPALADPGLPGALLVLPHRVHTDGFFVARLTRARNGDS